MTFPKEILSQHLAVLGKTGSGKTSTAKLAIEQVVADGARVCVLDPIKSDWWGLTSSADGKRAGLPFHILGGPHGHVPVHASAGKAIAEIVANGALPLSIIDMADFEPGGQAKFFVDFAPTLLRKMRGVVYLVIEEAHLFAPKERSGIGAENLSIHWAKTLATAGRSKGVRLVLVTQRTQALHNALLGSCDTLIAHRLTAPADQDPVVKWLKANTSKEVLERVAGSLASLKTGQGWICSGEAKLFELASFSRIKTYDNTATPTGDGETREIKTAPVDQEKLRAIIGEAVDIAKADDPRELRKLLAAAKAELVAKDKVLAEVDVRTKRIDEKVSKVSASKRDAARVEKIADLQQQLVRHRRALEEAMKILVKVKAIDFPVATEEDRKALEQAIAAAVKQVTGPIEKRVAGLVGRVEGFKLAAKHAEAEITALLAEKIDLTVQVQHREPFKIDPAPAQRAAAPKRAAVTRPDGFVITAPMQRILNALAWAEGVRMPSLPKGQLAFLADASPTSSSFGNNVSALRTAGLLDYPRAGDIALTDSGRKDAEADGDTPTTSDALQAAICAKLPNPQARLIAELVKSHPEALEKAELAGRAGASPTSSSFGNNVSSLRSLGLVDYPSKGFVIAAPALFLGL